MKLTNDTIKQFLENSAAQHYGVTFGELSERQQYRSVVRVVRNLLHTNRKEFNAKFKEAKTKRVHYISMEFLLGRSLKNNLYNMGLTKKFASVLKGYGVNLDDIYEREPDAGLGNGGLGRLAACYMDSLATLGYPSMGHCLFFEYGLFQQKIVDGWQTELPDNWLNNGGDVWFKARSDKKVTVTFGGEVTPIYANGKTKYVVKGAEEVEALPYDMVMSGYNSKAVSVLRLWQARNKHNFDMSAFGQGQYMQAVRSDYSAELITKVLYPADHHEVGKELRLKQEYFLCSAAMQNVTSDFYAKYGSFDDFAKQVAVHINDTHPAMCIPELMRIFLDDYGMEWDDAWKLVTSVCAYTNHTVMAEALECWPEYLIQKLLPRIYQIIVEINRRVCDEYFQHCGDLQKVSKIAIVAYNQVRMANLSVAGSHSVNGVSALHSEIIKKDQFADFYAITPNKFCNVTNGVVHRRWLSQSNPKLDELIKELIGDGYLKDANRLEGLLQYADDHAVLDRWADIKLENKRALADYAFKHGGIVLNPNTRFDVQSKRLHEYKRQLLNVIKIIWQYHEIKQNPNKPVTPQTYIFAAKAAPSYYVAKEIIKLICKLGEDIASNPVAKDKLAVCFLENYCVTMAETLIPATEVSEQISLAGKEASGTGNMKFMFNGAITLGTLDGANVEIKESVGDDNIFIFGNDEVQVARLGSKYSPLDYYLKHHQLRAVIEELNHGFQGESFANIAQYLLKGQGGVADPYMCFADFMDYNAAAERLDLAYTDKYRWQKMSLTNTAKAGRFSSDYPIKEYAKKIWKI